MIERIIKFSLKNKFIIGLFFVALICWGIYSLTRLPVDAIPDTTNNQVQVISLAPSLAVQEVESSITAPIEVAVANIPDIIELRSISRLGLSVVTVVFKDNVDIYWARQQLSERLKEAEESIPEGLAKIELAPVSTGLGEIYQYRLAVGKGYEHKYSAMDLRTLQDWVVRREMLGTPGVADINSYGGFVKQYEIAVNPDRLIGMGLTLTDIFDALQRNNENTGSAYIDKNPTSYFIRGLGLVKNLDDIGKIVIKNTESGIPILIRDVATVQYGNATRYGAFVVDTTEAVGGVVMMLKGSNAHEVIKNVEDRMVSIQKSLPAGVKIEPYLNRSDLVGRAIGTVSENLIVGALIVIFVLVLLLGDMRAGLIVASVIPLSMLFALSLMNLFGVSGNLMSLGAIDFGMIVDGAVIIVESVVHRIASVHKKNPELKRLTQKQMDETVFSSARRMMSSATFGQFIILIVYLPILALVGIEGKMFRPMAEVVTFALLGAVILSLTYVPVASSLFLSKEPNNKRNISDKIMDWIRKIYNPVLEFALRKKTWVVTGTIGLFVISLLIFGRLGGEFIPQLEEGDLAAGIVTLQGSSLTHTIGVVEKANKILLDNFPEIKHAVCKIGAGEIPTDPTPMETGDYIITLKDKSEWTSAKTREELVEKMEDKLSVLPGVKFEFQQPIQMRFNELLSGSSQDIAIKVHGDDLNTLSDEAAKIEKLIKNVKGVEDINVEKVTGLAQIQVEYDRDRLAQYGLSIQDANRILKTAFAGSEAGVVYDGEKRFGLVVRFEKDYRTNIDDVRNLTIALPNGMQIPFDQIADIRIKSGPAQVSREDTKRRITISFNVRNRDMQSIIKEVSHKIDNEIKMPTGYYVTYGGQFQNLENAKNRLFIAIPVALILIFILLYFTFTSLKQALLIFTTVPMSVIGGILALWIRGMNFSISAGVGFIALFGVAVLNGIVLIAEFNRLENEGVTDIYERVRKGLGSRIRPVMITASVASLGFLPMAISTSAGAEVQRPLATVVIGGLITATLLTLVVLPVFYILFTNHRFRIHLKPKRSVKVAGTIIIAALFSTGVTNAQTSDISTLDVNGAIHMALDSNLSVRSAAYSSDAQKALKGASLDLPKTSVEIQYGQFNSYKKDNSITIEQSFSFPTVYKNQNKLAKANIRNSELQLDAAKLEVATQVKQVYWQLAYLKSKQRLLEYQDSLYAGFRKAVELKTKTGEASNLEMVTARSQSLEISDKLRQIKADISTNNEKLKNLLNTGTDICISDTSVRKIEFNPVSDSSSIAGNPSMSISRQQTEISRIEKKLEESRIMPDLSIGCFSQTMQGTQDVNGVSRYFGANDRLNGIQASISVPLFFKSQSAKIKSARINERVAATNAESNSKAIESRYNSLLNDYRKYCSSLGYFENQALPETRMIIDQATKSYNAGAIDYLGYVQSLERAFEIRNEYLETLNDYNQTIISIDYITGKIY